MNQVIKYIFEIKDILEKTELIEVRLMHRLGKADFNELDNIIIKSIEYDDSKIIKSGFKLDIDFCHGHMC
jgi:hypothetical protein